MTVGGTHKSSSSLEPVVVSSLTGLDFGLEPPRIDKAVRPPTAANVPMARYSDAILRPSTTLEYYETRINLMHDMRYW